jgi:DNA-directed RNA polymerase specialized sigma24 family protein
MRNEENFSLWQAFQRGNRDAYRSFYNDYFGMLNNYGSKFSNNRELIEDAIHDLFVRLWTSREQLSTPPSIKNYLLKSLRNTLLRKMKKEEKYIGIDGQTYPL